MKRALLSILVLACLAAAPSAWGETRGHREAATALLDVMKESQDLSGVIGPMVDAQVRANPQIEPFRDILLDWTARYFSWDVIGPQMIDLYMRTFTESELRDLVAFYRTPTGRKSLEKMPALMQEGVKIGETVAQQHRGELEAMLKARMRELERTQQNAAGEGGASNEVAQGWLARAGQFYDAGKWEDAKNAYLRYLEENPDDVGATADLGVCYKELGDYDRALRNFDRALVLDPGHWQALYNKIIVLGFNVGKKAEAKKLIRELRRMQPNNPEVAQLAQKVAQL